MEIRKNDSEMDNTSRTSNGSRSSHIFCDSLYKVQLKLKDLILKVVMVKMKLKKFQLEMIKIILLKCKLPCFVFPEE